MSLSGHLSSGANTLMENGKQPLLLSRGVEDVVEGIAEVTEQQNTPSGGGGALLFEYGTVDIGPIKGPKDFMREFCVESKKLWYLAGPAVFTSICQYSLGAVTQLFAGHVSTIALAAVSVENSVIAGFSFGIMVLFKHIHAS